MGCAGQKGQSSPIAGNDGVIRGTVTYRERMALPPDAEVDVWLRDVTPGIQIMAVVAETTIASGGRQVPLAFELRYDPSRIVADHAYALRATIRGGGQSLFSTNTDTPVITQGHPATAEVRLSRVLAEAAIPPVGLSGTAWRLEDLAGTPVVANSEATLEFTEQGKVAGKGSCNSFFGTVTVSGETIQFGPIGATKMACLDAGISAQEGRYLKALQDAEGYTLEETTLLIYSKGMDKPLRFVKKVS